MTSILASGNVIGFVATTHPERAKRFYGETLGLRFVSEDGFAVVFDANGTMIRVSVVEELAPAPYTVLGWQVSDVTATIKALTLAGVLPERYPFLKQDDAGVWTAPGGAKIAWFKDPDGNTLSVTEFSSSPQ